MATGANVEQDFFSRIAALELAMWGGANPSGTAKALFESTSGSQIVPVVYSGSTDALAYPGTAMLTTAGVDATTLATPVVGTDDGKVLRVISTTANAHTITTAANKIAGGGSTAFGDTLTFAAKQGAGVTLMAYQGIWYIIALVNVTLSEV